MTATTGTARVRVGRVLLALVPLGFLAVFFVWPVGAVLVRGMWRHGSLDLGAFTDTLRDPGVLHVLRFTVWQATLSTLLTLAVGLPLEGDLLREVMTQPIRIRPLLAMPVLAVLVTMLYWLWRVRVRHVVGGLVPRPAVMAERA